MGVVVKTELAHQARVFWAHARLIRELPTLEIPKRVGSDRMLIQLYETTPCATLRDSIEELGRFVAEREMREEMQA